MSHVINRMGNRDDTVQSFMASIFANFLWNDHNSMAALSDAEKLKGTKEDVVCDGEDGVYFAYELRMLGIENKFDKIRREFDNLSKLTAEEMNMLRDQSSALLVHGERDARLELLKDELGTIRADVDRFHSLATFREEDHTRLHSAVQTLREESSTLRGICSGLHTNLRDRPTRNEVKSTFSAQFEPFHAKVMSRLDLLEASTKRVSKDLAASESRRESVQAAAVPLPADSSTLGRELNIDSIVEQVEARMFRRLDKMVNDRVELCTLRMREELSMKIDELGTQLLDRLALLQHKGLKSENVVQSNLQQHDAVLALERRASEHGQLVSGMKQVGNEQKLMQNSLISLRTQVRALARVVTGLKNEVARLQEASAVSSGLESGEVAPLNVYSTRQARS